MYSQNIKGFIISYQGPVLSPWYENKTGIELSTPDICYPVDIRQTVITDSLAAGCKLTQTRVEYALHRYGSMCIFSVATVFDQSSPPL